MRWTSAGNKLETKLESAAKRLFGCFFFCPFWLRLPCFVLFCLVLKEKTVKLVKNLEPGLFLHNSSGTTIVQTVASGVSTPCPLCHSLVVSAQSCDLWFLKFTFLRFFSLHYYYYYDDGLGLTVATGSSWRPVCCVFLPEPWSESTSLNNNSVNQLKGDVKSTCKARKWIHSRLTLKTQTVEVGRRHRHEFHRRITIRQKDLRKTHG